jgi:hypothetical protein
MDAVMICSNIILENEEETHSEFARKAQNSRKKRHTNAK